MNRLTAPFNGGTRNSQNPRQLFNGTFSQICNLCQSLRAAFIVTCNSPSYLPLLCVCVRACVRACVRVCARTFNCIFFLCILKTPIHTFIDCSFAGANKRNLQEKRVKREALSACNDVKSKYNDPGRICATVSWTTPPNYS